MSLVKEDYVYTNCSTGVGFKVLAEASDISGKSFIVCQNIKNKRQKPILHTLDEFLQNYQISAQKVKSNKEETLRAIHERIFATGGINYRVKVRATGTCILVKTK